MDVCGPVNTLTLVYHALAHILATPGVLEQSRKLCIAEIRIFCQVLTERRKDELLNVAEHALHAQKLQLSIGLGQHLDC